METHEHRRLRMPILSRLIAMAIAVLLPVAIAAGVGLFLLYKEQERATKENLQQLTRSLATVVERELAVIETTLRTLAGAPMLRNGDLKAFHAYAAATIGTFERTVVLVDPSGQQLLNTRVPFGQPLPTSRAYEYSGPQAMAERVVSDVYYARIGKQFSFGMRIPVRRDGEIIYYLTMGNYGSTLQKILADQRLKPDWNAAILDSKGVLLARRLDPGKFVGKPVTAEMMNLIREAPEGVHETKRLDNVESYTSYTQIPGTQWTLAASLPKSELRSTLVGAFQFAALITALALALALVLAYFVARSIARPVRDLVTLANDLGGGRPVTVPDLGMLETRQVGAEMARASSQLRDARDTLESRVTAAVADSRRAQDAILQNQKLEALGRLTGGIAHDFNNLLQTLSMSIEIAARTSTSRATLEALDAGRRATQNAAKLTRQLMSFARNSAGEVVTVDVRDQTLLTRDLVVNALRGDITLKLEMAGDLWPVEVDTVQFELALLNSALNARDAMPKGGTIVIHAANRAIGAGEIPGLNAGDYVQVRITDTGTGIPPEVLPRVFEPFFTTKQVGHGSGLGLAQFYGFAKNSGGIALIESGVGTGTTVSMLLPRTRQAVRATDNVPAKPAPALEGRCDLLLVEDDQLVQDVVVPALRSSGFNVIPADNADEALATLAMRRVDIVFSDIVMPGSRNGIELAEEIRKRFPDMPIVLATGFADEVAHAKGLRLLIKPYKLHDVESALLDELSRKPRHG